MGNGDQDVIKVGHDTLKQMADHITKTHSNLKDGFEQLTSELLRTLPEWGEGTESRKSYDEFKKRVDNIFQEMFQAVAKMPPVVQQAADEAVRTEKTNSGMWTS